MTVREWDGYIATAPSISVATERVEEALQAGVDPNELLAAQAAREACAWFAMCANVATRTQSHPVLGDVPICERCRALVAS